MSIKPITLYQAIRENSIQATLRYHRSTDDNSTEIL